MFIFTSYNKSNSFVPVLLEMSQLSKGKNRQVVVFIVLLIIFLSLQAPCKFTHSFSPNTVNNLHSIKMCVYQSAVFYYTKRLHVSRLAITSLPLARDPLEWLWFLISYRGTLPVQSSMSLRQDSVSTRTPCAEYVRYKSSLSQNVGNVPWRQSLNTASSDQPLSTVRLHWKKTKYNCLDSY